MDDMLKAVSEWDAATEPWCIPEDHFTNDQILGLVNTARKLNSAIIDAFPYPHMVSDTPAFQKANENWKLAYNVRASVRDLTAKFLVGEYTDSNTDEPNDVVWDVHNLHQLLNPGFVIPDEVRPSYVGNIFDGPPEDQV